MRVNSSVSAVVTGGSSGLGEAAARTLAHAGAKVAIFDMNEDVGAAVAQDIGGIFCKVDVTSDDEVDAGFAKARATFGQERILVNCAGIVIGTKTASRNRDDRGTSRFSMKDFERVVQVNLLGTFRCIAASAQGMLDLDPLEDGERGAIVCTSSIAAQDGQMGQAAYSASKAGVLGMTLPIARDLMNEGVRINTILPGLFLTPMMRSLPQNVQLALGASVPFPKRLGAPDEFAALVLHMLTNAYMNGECVRLDGANRLAAR